MEKYLCAFCLQWVSLFFYGQGSPDSRICNCFVNPVPAGFLHSTKAVYGTVGVTLSPGYLLQPGQSQPVRFSLPVPECKSGCNTSYTFYVADSAGQKVFESTGSSNVISYSFPACGKLYEVTLIVKSKSATGGDGNCSRQLRFLVRPVCNASLCECEGQKAKAGTSADFSINGKAECLSPTGTARRYVLRFGIINKSDCVLNILSITVHGQTIPVPAYNTAPGSVTNGISLGFSTSLNTSAPAGNTLNLVIRYSLNGRKCSAVQDIVYQPCQ